MKHILKKFEKKYLDKQGYLDLKKFCLANINYLIAKTDNSKLNIIRIESTYIRSTDLIKWSDFTFKDKLEIAKTLLENERKFYEKKASKVWEKPLGLVFCIGMGSFMSISVGMMGNLLLLIPLLSMLSWLLLSTLALMEPPILSIGLVLGFSYLLHKSQINAYKRELAGIDILEFAFSQSILTHQPLDSESTASMQPTTMKQICKIMDVQADNENLKNINPVANLSKHFSASKKNIIQDETTSSMTFSK